MAKKNVERAIVEAARILFARFGFKRTPVEQIAKQAKLSKATLYSYFPSKEALFARVVQDEADAMFAEVIRAVDEATDPADRIVALVKAHYQALSTRVPHWGTAATVLGEIFPLAFRAAEKQIVRGRQLIETLIRQGCEVGVFHCPDPAAAARALQFALRSMDMSYISMASDAAGFRQGYEELLELLVAGLKHDPRAPSGRDAKTPAAGEHR